MYKVDVISSSPNSVAEGPRYYLRKKDAMRFYNSIKGICKCKFTKFTRVYFGAYLWAKCDIDIE